jgi:PPOX class probable F420-dependent enzyme
VRLVHIPACDHGDMASGRAVSLEELPAIAFAIVRDARRAVLASIDSKGRPHVLPIGYAIVEGAILSAVDEKPKSGRRLARLANIDRNPTVTVTFDRWDEDWTRLGWVMVRGRATIEAPGTGRDALMTRYPQYGDNAPAGEVIAVTPEDIVWWAWDESGGRS